MAYYKCGSIHPTQNSNVVVDTASGAIANFQTPLAMPLLKTRFDFKATQDLHGQSTPYPAGCGINKWDEQWELGAWSSVNGTAVNYTDRIRCKNLIPVLPSTSYCIRFGTTASSVVNAHDENGDFIENLTTGTFGTGGRVITTPANCYFIKFSVGTAYGTTYNNDISVNYPSTDTAYHPYSNICPIDGWDEISVVGCGKNLYQYDESNIHVGTTSIGTTRAYLDLGFSGVGTFTFSAILKSGETPTSQYINVGKLSNGIITLIQTLINPDGTYNRTITFGEGDRVVLVSASEQTYAITSSLPKYNIQIEVSSSSSEIEPYNGSTTLINLGGTYYGGYVSQDKDGNRELVVTHKNIIVDDSFQPVQWHDTLKQVYFANALSDMPAKYFINKITYMSDKLLAVSNEARNSHIGNYISLITQGLGIGMSIPNCDTKEQAQNFLQNNSIQFVYELAEPFTVALPDGEPIKTLPGINNIYADTGDTSLQFRKIG